MLRVWGFQGFGLWAVGLGFGVRFSLEFRAYGVGLGSLGVWDFRVFRV